MRLNNLIDRLNEELNKIKNSTNYDRSYFTSDEHFNDDTSSVLNTESSITEDTKDNISEEEENKAIEHNESISDEENTEATNLANSYPDIEPDDETKSLTTISENRLLAAQTMFKKSIRMSLKAFLLSISLSFLNLFI